ncbi:imidazolonepropionase [Crassaminicella thermophila]|uniref:Imidazolonepropionase n=1 Tax=Crassaminicella thermophila TaxID=2599308 RepID=A0A5C0SAV2_CRATE|nr:imidazolonepropionase [Crassaminicella thermophila]QEK11067.1 imidazolonepropionase [Crassaminicella thermophila]
MDGNKVRADLVISNCKQILTCKEEAKDLIGKIDYGWIAIAGEKIVAVGTKEEVESVVEYDEDCVIDGSEKIVLPGFIDCHTHLVFGGSRVKEYAARMTTNDLEVLKKRGIKTGIMATVDMTRDMTEQALFDAAQERLKYMLCAGTTTVESKSGYGLTTSSEIKMLKINQKLNDSFPIDIVSTFLGAHGWPEDIPKDKYIHMLIWEMIPWVAELGLAQFCDVWCDDGHYTIEESRKILQAAREAGLEPKIHTDAYSYIGGSDLAAEMKMISADHLNYTPRSVMAKLAESKIPGVLLPAIDFAVRHPKPFNPRPMIEEGMTLALATNCCPGCFNISLQFVMMLACRQHGMSPEEALRAATIGGAMALNLQEDRGSLEVGKLADIQIWHASTYEDVIYRLGVNLVEKVIKRGKIVVENNIDQSFVQLEKEGV